MLASAWAQADDNVTFWVRMQDSAVAQPLVKAWNSSHKDQISLTVIPNDDFITKFGTAAASGNVPDILAVDLIYVPQLAKAGQLTDITDKAKALPYAATLSKAHMRLANANGRQYALPFSAEARCCCTTKACIKRPG